MRDAPFRVYARVAAAAFFLVALYTVLFKRDELADDWSHTVLHVVTGAAAAYAGWGAARATAARMFTFAIAVGYGALGLVGWFIAGIALDHEYRIPLAAADNVFHLALAAGAVAAVAAGVRDRRARRPLTAVGR